MASWSINVDLRDVKSAGIGSGRPDRGVYLAQITETERKVGEGKDSLRFTCKIVEDGPYKGMEPWAYVSLNDKEFNKRKLRTAVEAVADFHADPAKGEALLKMLDAGPVPLKDSFFTGKTVAIYVEPGEKLANGEYELDNNMIIRKAEYEKLKANGLPPVRAKSDAGDKKGPGRPKKNAATPEAGADPFDESTPAVAPAQAAPKAANGAAPGAVTTPPPPPAPPAVASPFD